MRNILDKINKNLAKISVSEVENSETFKDLLNEKVNEIERNYPTGRPREHISNNVKSGYLNEICLTRAIGGTMNELEFDHTNPNTFCYDVVSSDGKKIEVKSWNPNKSRWLNMNLLKTDTSDMDLLHVGHFDTLVKYNHILDYVITMFQEGDRMFVSAVFNPQCFKLHGGQEYGTYVKKSRQALTSGKQTSHYLDINGVERDRMGVFL